MRARNIKPGFFKNDDLAECSAMARLLFIGLWCMADRDGRMELRPKRIKAEIFPYDNCKIEALLEELRKYGFIVAYKFEGQNYLEIPTFTTHQNCHIKEAASTIPAPCESDTCTVVVGPLTESLLLNPESPLLNPESPLLNPESPLLKPPYAQSGAKRSKNGNFELFWKAYPKKKSKGQAEKAFDKINPDEQLLASMIAMIERAKKSEDWLKAGGQYIPHPATWLNAKGWEDEEVERDELSGKVSDTTRRNIAALQDWRPPA